MRIVIEKCPREGERSIVRKKKRRRRRSRTAAAAAVAAVVVVYRWRTGRLR